MKADLHIHSCYSDSTLTPAEILAQAETAGVTLLSLTDHDTDAGYDELLELNEKKGLSILFGTELDCICGEKNYHVLGYSFNRGHSAIRSMLTRCRDTLEQMSIQLLSAMESDYPAVSLEEFSQYVYDPIRGGWAGMNYLLDKRLAASFTDVMTFQQQYGVTYAAAGFPTMDEVCAAIHNAGGKAVLAHPGEQLVLEQLEDTVPSLLEQGLDGIECFYPSHKKDLTNWCMDFCKKNALLITCGSDSHGAFCAERKGSAFQIGSLDPDWDLLNLKGLF